MGHMEEWGDKAGGEEVSLAGRRYGGGEVRGARGIVRITRGERKQPVFKLFFVGQEEKRQKV